MRKWAMAIAAGLATALAGAALAQQVTAPAYAPNGKMLTPQDYRSWIFLSSGFDMSYTNAAAPSVHGFNNVFVNRAAYDAFLKTGIWPDKTVLILETRAGSSDDPILKQGQFQAGAPTGLEAHVKDASKGGWAFYSFGKGTAGDMIPRTANCYSCHAEHARTDTTFTQLYPTLADRPAK